MTDPRSLTFWVAFAVGWFGIALVVGIVFGQFLRFCERGVPRGRQKRGGS